MDGLNRFFAFGCSYTGFVTATWADLIGPNFKEYYNFGRGGACNTYIMGKFVEANDLFRFSSNDYVVVMFTGISRFSFYNREGWVCNGNVYHDGIDKGFVENMWTIDWGVYNTWIAIKTIKTTLDNQRVNYKLVSALDNSIVNSSFYSDLKETSKKYYDEYVSLLDDSEALDTWKNKHYHYPTDYYRFGSEQYADGHPTQTMHYRFVKEKFSQFDTEKTKEVYELAERSLNLESYVVQAKSFYDNINKPYNKALNYTLF